MLVAASNAYGSAAEAASSSVTVVASALATFDPAYTGSNYTLSNSNKTVTHNASTTMLALLQGFKSSGKFWIEFEMVSGANVEYTGAGSERVADGERPRHHWRRQQRRQPGVWPVGLAGNGAQQPHVSACHST